MEPRRTPTVALPSPAEGSPAAARTHDEPVGFRFDTLLNANAGGAAPQTAPRPHPRHLDSASPPSPPSAKWPAHRPPVAGAPVSGEGKSEPTERETPKDDAWQALAGSLAATIVQLLVPEVAVAEQGLIAAATGEAIAGSGMSPETGPPPGDKDSPLSRAGDPHGKLSAAVLPELPRLEAANDAAAVTEVEPALTASALPNNHGTASLARAQIDRATPDEASRSRSSPDGGRLLKRFARAVAAAQQREGEIRLRLHSPELGSLKLEVQVRDGALVARVEAETADARAALLENLPVLRERLSEQGLRIERFAVELMQQQAGNHPQPPPEREHPPPPVLVRQAPSGETPPPQADSAQTPFPRRRPGRLNVII